MSYGVTIESGAMPWQIFQQDGGGKTCIQLTGGYTCGRFTHSRWRAKMCV